MSETANPEELLMDSGSTEHILNNKKNFLAFDEDYEPQKHYIELANGTKVQNISRGRGTARIPIHDANGRLRSATLSDVLYIPSFPCNIFSVKSATKKGATVTFGGESGIMRSRNGTIFPISSRNDLYFLNLKNNTQISKRGSLSSTYFARFGNNGNSTSNVSPSIKFSTKLFATTKLSTY